jgi:hypothetical protein
MTCFVEVSALSGKLPLPNFLPGIFLPGPHTLLSVVLPQASVFSGRPGWATLTILLLASSA